MSTVTTAPWQVQDPFIRTGLMMGDQLMDSPPTYYGGSTVTPFSDTTNMAMNARQNRALQGSPHEAALGGYLNQALGQNQFDLTQAGQTAGNMMGASAGGLNQLGQTAQGDYLNSNPYLDSMFNSAASRMGDQFDRAQSALNATFSSGGRTGSGAHADAFAETAGQFSDSLGSLAADVYGGNYQRERERQMQASGMLQQGGLAGAGALNSLYGSVDSSRAKAGSLAPVMTGLEYGNIDQLAGVGGMVDQQSQNMLQDDINRWNHGENAQWDRTRQYMGLVGNPMGGTTHTPNPSGSPVTEALGRTAAGAGAGFAVGGPIGAAVGAGLGGGSALIERLWS